MDAKVEYQMVYLPHPWDEKLRAKGVNAWCIVRKVKIAGDTWPLSEPVALFNLDSEAERFMLGGGKVLPPEQR